MTWVVGERNFQTTCNVPSVQVLTRGFVVSPLKEESIFAIYGNTKFNEEVRRSQKCVESKSDTEYEIIFWIRRRFRSGTLKSNYNCFRPTVSSHKNFCSPWMIRVVGDKLVSRRPFLFPLDGWMTSTIWKKLSHWFKPKVFLISCLLLAWMTPLRCSGRLVKASYQTTHGQF